MVFGRRGWGAVLAVALGAGGVFGPATAATAAKRPVVAKKSPAVSKPQGVERTQATRKPPAARRPHANGKPRLVLDAAPLVAIRSGGRVVVHEELWNLGNAPENAQVVLGLSLPPGVSVTSLPAGCIPQPQGHVADCLFPAGLKPGHADRVDIPIASASGMKPGVLAGQARGGTVAAVASGSPTRFLLVVLH
ncbi:hypothetical protein [Streptacidiphilus anmyonensis]|uniref:hypothetical protein n=1 Tax=Streptacidiphilus anmyonensis TaxID=405782 RepID=UPI0005A9545D|nr:hypothetical protein [Streptacidiphilus anmyonensis]